MSLAIDQSAQPAGKGRWDWSVWVDGPDAELDQVDSVEWILQPTFTPSAVLVTDRESKFKLDNSGWGEFEISALVRVKSGSQQHLKHRLRLAGTEDAPEAAPDENASVFISAGISDGMWEDAVRQALTSHGVNVYTASDLPPSVPVEAAISSILDQASVIVGIFSARPAPWAEHEVKQALQKDVPVIPLTVGPDAKVPPALRGRQAVHLQKLGDVDSAVDRIVGEIS